MLFFFPTVEKSEVSERVDVEENSGECLAVVPVPKAEENPILDNRMNDNPIHAVIIMRELPLELVVIILVVF